MYQEKKEVILVPQNKNGAKSEPFIQWGWMQMPVSLMILMTWSKEERDNGS